MSHQPYPLYLHDYLDMIQGITELKTEMLYLTVKTPKTDARTNGLGIMVQSALTAAAQNNGISFGFAMRSTTPSIVANSHSPSQSPSPSPSGSVSGAASPQPTPGHSQQTFIKTESLLHSEAAVYMSFQEFDSTKFHRHCDTLGGVLLMLHDTKVVTTLDDVVDMLAACVFPDIRLLYLHVATIVAFHHYIRVVVHQTGNYKAKKTIALLEEYKNVLIQGFMNTALTREQDQALRHYSHP